ncbi:MAG: hypothetical protein ACI8XG_001893 [Congregibacter sp.]|jgi:hypothetical protein
MLKIIMFVVRDMATVRTIMKRIKKSTVFTGCRQQAELTITN